MSDLLVTATALERRVANQCSIDLPAESIAAARRADHCSAALLPWLAWSRHVDEWPTDIALQREATKQSIRLHKLKGSVAAVNLAIEITGLDGEVIDWDAYQGSPHTFRVNARIKPGSKFSDSAWGYLFRRIEDAKNARSHLDKITLHAETSGTSHRTLRTSGRANIIAYPAQPSSLSQIGEKHRVAWTKSQAELRLYPEQPLNLSQNGEKRPAALVDARATARLYPEQPTALSVFISRVAGQALAATSTTTIHPEPV